MNWVVAFEIVGFIGGITTFIALMLAPMFYLGSKIDNIHKDLSDINGRLSTLERSKGK